MKKILVFLTLLTGHICLVFGQPILLETRNGDEISPRCTLQVLNVFVNIIYDQTPAMDPCNGLSSPFWMPGPPNTINQSLPSFLPDYMDSNFDPNNIRGYFTRRYAESSFNNFIVLGDFVIVNIAQSSISTGAPDYNFTSAQLIDGSIELINNLGGLQTVNGNNELSYYDRVSVNMAGRFQPKTDFPDTRIDFIFFYYRNSRQGYGQFEGGGQTGFFIPRDLIVGGIHANYNGTSVEGAIRDRDMGHPSKNTTGIHELMHNLVVPNSMHMGGGTPIDGIGASLISLDFQSGGWSLLGGAGSSLHSCNAFERWRLDWRGPQNNAFPIAASNIDSDIENSEGSQTLYLRDFMTYGDAIRIELPYRDAGQKNYVRRLFHGCLKLYKLIQWNSPLCRISSPVCQISNYVCRIVSPVCQMNSPL